jgi:hypothetical protein
MNMNMVELNGRKVLVQPSGRVDQGQGHHPRRRAATEDDQAKKSKMWPMVEE